MFTYSMNFQNQFSRQFYLIIRHYKKYSLILTSFSFPFIKFHILFRRYNIVHFETNFVTFYQKCFRYDDSKDKFYRLMVIRILLPCDSISLAAS